MNEYETYVSIETAKLLKQLGFNWKIHSAFVLYEDNGGFSTEWQTPIDFNGNVGQLFNDYGGHKEVLSRPTLNCTQKWLREKKNINIYLHCYMDPDHDRVYWLAGTEHLEPVGFEEEEFDIFPNTTYGTYEEELENCIIEVLKWLIKQEKK